MIPITNKVSLTIPQGTVIQQPTDKDPVWSVKKIDDKYLVVIDNETYMLGINAGGLCPWDPANPDFVDETNCGYTDKVLANSVVDIQTFRIWKDNRGVFALNPQTVKVNTTEIDFFLIQKSPKTESFSASEIELWENILLNGLR